MTALCVMTWSIAGQSNKLDQLIANTSKLEKRVDERDTRTDSIKENQYEMRRVQDSHAMRLEALERSIRK